jgi:drug resistance transporter, EmrB/QacA subfamily
MTTDPVKTPTNSKGKIELALLKIEIILLIGGLAALLDTTMVNVAVHTLTTDLHTTVSAIQWVITGYLLAMSMTVPVSGWAVNRFGGKRMWLVSLTVFLAGSILSGVSWDTSSLILFRILQGIGAGLIFPILTTLAVQAAGGHNLGQVMSFMSLPALFAPIFGPVLGGIIVQTLGWHWIFFINIPVCIAAIALAWWELPESEVSGSCQDLDIAGLLLLSPALALLVYAISQAGSSVQSSFWRVVIPLAIGLILAGIFILHASSAKKSAMKKMPIIDLRLFASRYFSASCILFFLIGAISAGSLLLLPLYFQQVRGADVLFTGLWLIPEGLGMLLTRSWIGNLTDHVDARVLIQAGLVVTLIGIVPFSFIGPTASPVIVAVLLFVVGIGMGGGLIPVMVAAYRGLAGDQISHASSATRIFQLIGGAFGSAAIAVILQQELQGYGSSGIAAVTNAYAVTFWGLSGMAVIAIFAAFYLPRKSGDTPRP